MATSDTTEGAKPLKTERRTDVSGGIDTRSSVASSPANKVTAIGNFRLTKDGSITKRLGAQQLCTVQPFSNASTDLQVPVALDNGVGTLAAGDYTFRYSLGSNANLTNPIGASPNSNTLTIGANRQISVFIPAVNSGETIGTKPPLTVEDDPRNGGFRYDAAGGFILWCKKAGDPNFTKQTGFVDAIYVSGGGAGGNLAGRFIVFNTYSNNLAIVSNTTVPVPIRALFYHAGLEATIGVVGARAFALTGAHTAAAYLAQAKDSLGVAFGFSILPSRMSATVIRNVMVLADGFGRPKRLATPNASTSGLGVQVLLRDPTLWSFRQVGANPPIVAPTLTLGGVGITGAYFYCFTWVYQNMAQDGSLFWSESNSSPTSLVTNPANQTVTVTLPAALEDPGSAVAGAAAGNIVAAMIYRTLNGGSDFFLAGGVLVPSTAPVAFNDNLNDNLTNGKRPPDKLGKVPNDPPRAGLGLVTEHDGRLYGVQFNCIVTPFSTAIGATKRLAGTNLLFFSKQFVEPNPDILGRNPVPSITASFPIPDTSNFDAWNSTFLREFCGSGSPVTALKSFRGVLYCIKEDEIGVIEGQQDTEIRYRAIWKGSGAMANSIIECGNYLLAFDQAMGPISISGYNVTDLGYATIQQDWIQAVTVTAGEAVSGGGRSATGVISAVWDQVLSEARWVISDWNVDPTSGTATGTTPKFFEYVCQMPSGHPSEEFTRFTGAVSGTNGDRRILTQTAPIVGVSNLAYRSRDIIYGDYHGRVCLDNSVGGDLNALAPTAISLRATWPFFFGDNLEMVKLFKHLYILFQMGATGTDSLVVQIRSLSKGAGAPVTVATLVGSGALAGLDRMQRVDIGSVDGTNSAERGISVDIFGSAQSDILNISEICLKYQDVSEVRNAP